ncbi:tight adherence protein C [Caldalkalibacillus uzonensis]|uniref:Tight adherence protein C n=1 Tax=Caldalkalibacillus uzonensis TaxID=353224 RepID=A0ABU0CPP6_9BACI|nr:type II secretion system F family protein [Caldalkalibacillus uzonensis]MDQ0337876.1 tight adherence protein C [Caldalkalibacillus uzonensis]
MNDQALSGLIVLLIGLILVSLLISFVYIWLFVAKKQNLTTYLGFQKRKKRQKVSFKDRVWNLLLKGAAYVGPTAIKYPMFTKPEQDRYKLMLAGNPRGMDLQLFYGFRLVVFFAVFFCCWFYFMIGMPLATPIFLAGPVLGFFLPHVWLKYRAKERQEEISAMMPDFLDTVSISLQAGASLDGALRQVSDQMEGPLSEEIQRLLREISLGVSREKAYENLLSRNNARELEILIQALIQGTQLGVPVARTFRVQAEDLRQTRGFKAREKAAKASPKITLVTTITILPSVFLLVIGLLILNFIYNPDVFGLNIFFQ